MGHQDDGAGDPDIDLDEEQQELERHAGALRDLVMRYIEENDLVDEFVADLLVDIGLDLRKVAYVLGTTKPSTTGLKLELDRYRAEVEEAVRLHKKDAERFVRAVVEAKQAAEADAADDEPAAATSSDEPAH